MLRLLTPARIAIVVVVILAILVILAGIQFVRSSSALQSVTEYQNDVIDKTGSPVCPGETLTFTQTAQIRNAPAVTELVETVIDKSTGRTVIPEREPLSYNHPRDRQASGEVQWVVPDLPAGNYELARSTTPKGSRISQMYLVEFVVRQGCKKE